MERVTIVNVVATAALNQELDLDKLGKFREITHDKAIYGGRVAYFKTPVMEGKVSIFTSGKIISVGTKSREKAFCELEYVKQFLVKKHLIELVQLHPKINNMVVTVNFDEVLSLEELAKKSKMIYEPEQFPAGILKIKEPHEATVLIFSSGRAVITGLKDACHIGPTIKKIENVVAACV